MKGMRRNLNVNEIASLGSNVKPVIQNENCSILMLNDATGEGVMTIYRVLPGVMICFSDMHMEQCVSEFELKNDRKIFCMESGLLHFLPYQREYIVFQLSWRQRLR